MSEASPRGTYLIIADALRKEIAAGQIQDGALPSEADLMARHKVARNTVRRALKVLADESLVVSVPGAGWMVSSTAPRPLVDRLREVITEDGLAVGDPYPSEQNLCARFGASRTAVRSALAQMEGMGLLATVHGKGRTVRALTPA
ncbi:GntR family transcriptional regulator [Streptomyces fungicidicus]|uniref:Winged helix-turn-helix transcriptional regulator n=1 Tax=Streptomyces fungicidicus TaxID=68203 RepID=A0ACC7XWQ8_9ACTN|nr:winged helix-turn-helix domain-containing protein [Streptomyces fungicidicus]NUV74128.1 winged helix-turn-helix transcriptional regulator [Streptomyces fungicidicus]